MQTKKIVPGTLYAISESTSSYQDGSAKKGVALDNALYALTVGRSYCSLVKTPPSERASNGWRRSVGVPVLIGQVGWILNDTPLEERLSAAYQKIQDLGGDITWEAINAAIADIDGVQVSVVNPSAIRDDWDGFTKHCNRIEEERKAQRLREAKAAKAAKTKREALDEELKRVGIKDNSWLLSYRDQQNYAALSMDSLLSLLAKVPNA